MSRDELLKRLARLDGRDRAWLLGELSPGIRRGLIEDLAGEDSTFETEAAPAPVAAVNAGWESMDPAGVAGIMEREPVWLVSVATRASEPRWRERLLHHMPHRRRQEIELADRAGGALNARAARLVLETCRERMANGRAAGAPTAPRGGFSALVEQMKARFA